MPHATTPRGDLIPLDNAWLFVPNFGTIKFHALPDISDSKSAAYNDEPIIGSSFPLKTYSHSENRVISLQIHFYARKRADFAENLRAKRAIESCLYPRDNQGFSFVPPPVCRLYCGFWLADDPLCVVLKSCSSKAPTDVPWDEETYCPWKFDVDTNWEVVYKRSDLPGQNRILNFGR